MLNWHENNDKLCSDGQADNKAKRKDFVHKFPPCRNFSGTLLDLSLVQLKNLLLFLNFQGSYFKNKSRTLGVKGEAEIFAAICFS